MRIGSFVGLSTGIDWQTVVDQIVGFEGAPMKRIMERRTEAEAAKSAWGKVHDLLTTLRTANNDLRFGRTFESIGTEVGKTSVGIQPFTASALASADEAAYDVEVVALARAEAMASAGVADPAAALGLTGTFDVGGQTITLAAGDSLNSVRDQINGNGGGATASVLMVSPGVYQLSIKANDTGAAGLGYVDGPEGVGAALGLATTVTGADAQVRVDGTLFTRTENTIDDIITGVTLELTSSSAGESVELSVKRNMEEVADKVGAWVEAFNAVVKYVDGQQSRSEGAKAPPLHRQSGTTRHGESLLKGALGSALFEVGLELDRSGHLEFDRAAFLDAYADDPAAVETRLETTLGVAMEDAILDFGIDPESIVVMATASAERAIESLKAQESRWESRLEVRRDSLLKQFTQVETLLGEMQSQMASLGNLGSGGMMGAAMML